MRVSMIGSGYVGLVSGACFSQFGHHVTCVDKDADRIEMLKHGRMPIYEPGLDDLVARNVEAGRLDFTTDLGPSVGQSDAVFIAVGTPSRRGDGHADLTYVMQAAEELAPALRDYTVVVTKSTVPVGTGDAVDEAIRRHNPEADFDVASNPEFLREGSAIGDFTRPDRIVVGTASKRAREVVRELYRPLFLNETPVLFTGRATAELIKYAANAFLATKISFINEIANLCERTGADVQDVARGIGLDGRIGAKFLHAGPGYGGSCFPKDTLALLQTAQDLELDLQIVGSVVKVNEDRKRAMAEKVIAACGGDVAGKTVAVLGLTFKPNTDDMRDAPSLVILPALQAAGARIQAFDPVQPAEAAQLLPDVALCADAYEAMQGADAIVIVTEWDEFRALDFDRIRDLMQGDVIVDLRNIYRPEDVAARGFDYVSVGRPVPEPGVVPG
jgi:UDPglucose 6-dehydrogenase